MDVAATTLAAINCTVKVLGWLVLCPLVLGIVYVLLRKTIWAGRLAATKPDGSLRRVLVTGCDSGFGHGLARKLHKEGYHVYAGCLFQKSADALNAELGERMTARRMNVTKDSDVTTMVATVKRDGGDLWAIVNNAGILVGAHVEWTPLSDFEQVMSVNYLAGVRVTKAFLPLLRRSHGRVINVTSAAGFAAAPGMGPYCASKFAFEAFTESLRLELRPFGVTVCAVEPGFFLTPLVQRSAAYFEAMYRRLPKATRALWGDEWWAARLSRTQQVSGLAGDPSVVVTTLFKAVCAKYPSPRYQVGWDCQVLYNLVHHLPTRLRDPLYALLLINSVRPAAAGPGGAALTEAAANVGTAAATGVESDDDTDDEARPPRNPATSGADTDHEHED